MLNLIEEVNKCTQCGYCNIKCSSSSITNSESWSPRGKLSLISEWLKGNLSGSENDYFDRLFSCESCDDCNSVCPVNINISKTIVAARNDLLMKHPEYIDKLNKKIKQRNQTFSYEKTVLNYDYSIFYCCDECSNSEDMQTLIKILEIANCTYNIISNDACCGYPSYILGNWVNMHNQIKKSIEHIKINNLKNIIILNPVCKKMMDDVWYDFSYTRSFKIIEVTTLLSKLINQGKISPNLRINLNTTFHESCLTEEKTKSEYLDLLKQIPGIHLYNIKSEKNPCGGGSFIYRLYPSISKKLSETAIKKYLKSNIELVICSNNFCVDSLTRSSTNFPIVISNIFDIIYKSINEK